MFKKGQIAWNKGKKASELSRQRMSDSRKGKPTWNKGLSGVYSDEYRKKISDARKGKHNSPRTEFKRGMKSTKPMLGRKMLEESKRKISEGLRGMFAGEKNPMWKGGVTSLKERLRKTFKYRQWRSDVFTRDNFTCVWCDSNNNNGNRTTLNADHIKPFALILEENKITSIDQALECEEIWNINNGRTLCVSCHQKTDTYLNRWKK